MSEFQLYLYVFYTVYSYLTFFGVPAILFYLYQKGCRGWIMILLVCVGFMWIAFAMKGHFM